MSFAPALPATGPSGWTFLKRTAAAQQATMIKSPAIQRDAEYFRSRISSIDTADQLVSDRRLLRISLEAFGLEADIENRAFIRKVLSDGTFKNGALAMRLTDSRYRALAEAFGFGDFPIPNTKISDFPDKILRQWHERRFETAVGARDADYRLALNATRELAALAASASTEAGKWFKIMGNPPLRTVVQKALNLPDNFVALDIDRQLTGFADKAAATFGESTVSQFADPARTEELVRRFLIRADLDFGRPQPAAFTLLSQARSMLRRL